MGSDEWTDLDLLRWIIDSIVEEAKEIKTEYDKEPSEFLGGQRLAMYCVLDTIANRAEVCEVPLDNLGLDPEFIQSLIR